MIINILVKVHLSRYIQAAILLTLHNIPLYNPIMDNQRITTPIKYYINIHALCKDLDLNISQLQLSLRCSMTLARRLYYNDIEKIDIRILNLLCLCLDVTPATIFSNEKPSEPIRKYKEPAKAPIS